MYIKTAKKDGQVDVVGTNEDQAIKITELVRNDSTFFIMGGEKILLLSEQPIKSLGRQYTVELTDKQMGRSVMKQLSEGLAKIDQSQLPGKYKVWCYQFTLYRRVMWPLKMSEIPSSTASKMDGKANAFIRKWLGLPRCLSEMGIFGRNNLQLPLQSISLGYKQEKTRLVLELRESAAQAVRNANPKVLTSRKWNAQTEVDQAVSRLQHQEIVGRVQKGRAGLGWGEAPLFWSRANHKERKEMAVAEVTKMEEERYRIKAVSQCRQGSWTTWERVVNRNITWSDLWKIPQARLSFLIQSTYDTLPCPRNLHQWFGSEEDCTLCNTPNANLQHILSNCKIALSQGRYRWLHDQVMRKLAEVLEGRRQGNKGVPPAENHNHISFVKEDGGKETSDQEKQLGRFPLTRSGTLTLTVSSVSRSRSLLHLSALT